MLEVEIRSDAEVIDRAAAIKAGSYPKYGAEDLANAMECIAYVRSTWDSGNATTDRVLAFNTYPGQIFPRGCISCAGEFWSDQEWAAHMLSLGHLLTHYRTKQEHVDEARAILHAFPMQNLDWYDEQSVLTSFFVTVKNHFPQFYISNSIFQIKDSPQLFQ